MNGKPTMPAFTQTTPPGCQVWKRAISISDEFQICMATGDNEYEEAEGYTYQGKAPGAPAVIGPCSEASAAACSG